MLHVAGAGFSIILLAGIVQGTVLTPMPYLRKWSWENIWLPYSSFAYLILPWPFALITIPHLLTVLSATPHQVIVHTLLMGFLWGLAVVLFGVGVDMLGLALGTAIIMGLGTSVGSLVPLVGQHREQLWAPSGLCTLAGVVLLTLAVGLFSAAGKQRDQILRARSGEAAAVDSGLVRGGRFLGGLIVCILCGFLNPLINIAFAYGSEIQKVAVEHGASATSAGNAVWLLVANAGFFPSLIYSLYLLKRNQTWSTFRAGSGKYWLLPPLMGLMWISGTVMYGVGANAMGSLGPAIGWPVFLSTTVLVANSWGFFTHEWKGIHGRPLRLQTAGLIILIAAMFTLGLASRF
jgi:L-rhamnose-H+ transport protein